ncbi:MAG: DUF4340 domain-containing protein [Verrucomicrobiaceae bacterium]|nr:DUF4340 domain-containing protein [Verrucomicrobiaceae bacterium]
MRFRLTVFLAVANIVLFLLIWSLERERNSVHPSQDTLPPFTKLEISGKNVDKPRVLKFENNYWRIVSPIEWKANLYAVNGIKTRLNFLGSQTSFSQAEVLERGHTLAEYGLDDPAYIIRYGDGDKMQTVKVGKNTSVGDRFYLLDESKGKIVVVDRELIERFISDMEDLRDQSIFTMSRFEVTSFSVRSPVAGFNNMANVGTPSSEKSDFKRVGLVKDSSGWKFETPIVANADNVEVEAFLNDVCRAVAVAFVDGKTEKTGFELASLPSTITLQGTNRREVLMLGALSKDGKFVYARLEDNPTIFALDASILKKLDIMQTSLRDKVVLRTSPSQITGIDISENNKVLKLRKLKNNQWDVIGTDKNGKAITFEANLGLVNKLLLRLERVRVRQFVNDTAGKDLARYGISDNSLKISIISNNDKITSISFGEFYRKFGVNLRYANINGDSSVYGVGMDLSEITNTDLLYYRSTLVCSLKADDVLQSIKIEDIQKSATLLDITATKGDFSAGLSKMNARKASAIKEVEAFVKNTVANSYSSRNFNKDGVLKNSKDIEKWHYKLSVKYLPKDADTPVERTWLLTKRTGATIQFCSVVGEDVLFFPEMNFINAFFELTQDSFEPEQLKKSQPVSPKK